MFLLFWLLFLKLTQWKYVLVFKLMINLCPFSRRKLRNDWSRKLFFVFSVLRKVMSVLSFIKSFDLVEIETTSLHKSIILYSELSFLLQDFYIMHEFINLKQKLIWDFYLFLSVVLEDILVDFIQIV